MAPSPSTHSIVHAAPAPTPAGLVGNLKRMEDLRGADLLTAASLTRGVVLGIFERAAALKRAFRSGRAHLGGAGEGRGMPGTPMAGRTAVLLFEKPSLRTKMSFETGIGLLGGRSIFMDHSSQRLGERESVKDYARNLERWVDCIIARVFSQEVLYELAEHARVPVINALSDRFHPCQGVADVLTLWEEASRRGMDLREVRLAYVGDGNNVCHSLMHVATMVGMGMTVVTPKGYGPAADVVAECEALARESGARLEVATSVSAAKGHHAVYTDVWVSMGQADTAAKRRKVFAGYQVSAEMMRQAGDGLSSAWGPARFMHCLPAQRGVEVTDEVIDSPASLVYEQAENRMHAQDALLWGMFGGSAGRE